MTDNALTTIENSLPPDAKTVDELAKSINLEDSALTLTYGSDTMTDISRFADDMLGRVRAKDAGPVGENMTNLLLKVKEVDINELSGEKKSFLESLPIIGNLFSSVERRMAKFNTLAGEVEGIAQKLDSSMISLLKDIEVLDQLYKHNKDFHDKLSVYIDAGKKRLEEARNVELPKLQQQAAESKDNMDAQKVKDFADKINRFERRISDLEVSRTVTVQTAPQIRLIQSNDQTLAEKIQTSILTTIPIWKSQMVLGLSLYGQKEAAKLQKDVADTTNQMLRENAEMLETASVDTAREVERSVVDIETLRDVQQRLVSTIEQTMQIAEEGRNKRKSMEAELSTMEEDLRKRLTSLSSQKAQQEIASAATPSSGALPSDAPRTAEVTASSPATPEAAPADAEPKA
ncbi:toxic anion resistance protein [Desulfovibrio sp. OttesenSCG-928-G15]|nr:toxic anion resistance protein [Desulfovibrio sp. OttesenSCG-928-G15]